VKRSFLLIIFIVAVAVGGFLWIKKGGGAASPAAAESAAAKPADEGEGPKVTRDTNGNAVININDEAQGEMGIIVKKPEPIQMSPELKGYGHVLDPAPLAALMTELASAQAAYAASSNELARLKMLEGQGNASPRAVQPAEATALRDRLAVQSALDRLMLSWGKAVADQKDLPAFIQSLASRELALIRLDLTVGEALQSPPASVRISTLYGQSFEGQFLGPSPNVDPQLQGQGYLFVVKTEASRPSAGEAVAGFLKVPGEPLTGVIVPREAVVRTEGSGWIYVMTGGGETFTRTEIALDHPVEAGWFVTKGVNPGDYIVVTAAQQLLSLELKGQGGE
jgi:hypothetical protein